VSVFCLRPVKEPAQELDEFRLHTVGYHTHGRSSSAGRKPRSSPAKIWRRGASVFCGRHPLRVVVKARFIRLSRRKDCFEWAFAQEVCQWACVSRSECEPATQSPCTNPAHPTALNSCRSTPCPNGGLPVHIVLQPARFLATFVAVGGPFTGLGSAPANAPVNIRLPAAPGIPFA
jgi:hypothetical protein